MEATDLPFSLSHFVFCQFRFWTQAADNVVPPVVFPPDQDDEHPCSPKEEAESKRMAPNGTRGECREHARATEAAAEGAGATRRPASRNHVIFNSIHEFRLFVTEEFLEYLSEGYLSIEVWGNRTSATSLTPPLSPTLLSPTARPGRTLDGTEQSEHGEHSERSEHRLNQFAPPDRHLASLRCNTIEDRWNEMTRKVQLLVDILELNEQGTSYILHPTPYRYTLHPTSYTRHLPVFSQVFHSFCCVLSIVRFLFDGTEKLNTPPQSPSRIVISPMAPFHYTE